MIHILYSALIAPLEEGLLHALPALFAITNSWGIAILLMSVGVNLVLLPFYKIAQQWQQADRTAQERLRPKLQEIKSAFKGEERFMMTKTLYRQARYHPFLAIRSAAGFLIQVPVFIAAYLVLFDFDPITGVAFGPFANLARPDGLLQFGSFTVNVMPLVMTALNLFSVSLSPSATTRREKIQLWVVAAVFLALLYNLPVALVLYWTMNNVFSLGKSFVERRAHTASKWVAWELVPIGVLFLVLFVVDPWTLWQTPSTLGVKAAIAAFMYVLLLRLLRTTRFRREGYYGMKRLVPLAAFTVSLLYFVQEYSSYRANVVALAIAFCLGIGYFVLAIERDEVSPPLGLNVSISAFALSSIVFIFNPLLMYFGSPDRIGAINELTFISLLILTATGTFLLIKMQAFVGMFRRAYTILLAWSAAAVFIYSYVAIFNYGLMRGGRFSEEGVLIETLPNYLPLELAALVILGIIVTLLVKRWPHALPAYFTIVMLALTYNLASAYEGYRSGNAAREVFRDDEGELPKIFRFSPNRNILLLVPDATPGPLISGLFQGDPALREAFGGFVVYENTAAVGTFTMSNSAALLGGPDYTPYEINKRRDHTLERLVIETYRGLISKLEQNDYSVNVMNPTLVECDALAEVGDCGDTLSYRDILYNKYDYDMVSAFDKRLLFMLSAFKALPLSLKSTLYQSEYWTDVFDTPPMTAQSERYYEHLFVESLPRFSEVATGRDENRFVHLWLDGLVAPFFLDASCEIADRSWEMWGMAARRDSANCMFTGLGQWFAWMKENGVYDNTKIIIVADHGAGEFGETWYQNAATPVLMVKDFDRHDPIERSDMLMSNSDVLSIICGALDSGCDDVPADPTKSPAEDRVLTFSITTHGDADFFRNSKAFDIVRYYEISGSVHDRDGWVEKEPTK